MLAEQVLDLPYVGALLILVALFHIGKVGITHSLLLRLWPPTPCRRARAEVSAAPAVASGEFRLPGHHFLNFSPAVGDDANKAISKEIRSWRINRRSDKTLTDLARMFNPILHGWINYYGRFYKSMLYPTLRRLNDYLVRWAMQKFKRLHRHANRARKWLQTVARRDRGLFAHWRLGLAP